MADAEIVNMLGRKREIRANKNGTPRKGGAKAGLARGRATSRSPGRGGANRFGPNDMETSPGPGGADINANTAWKDLQKQRAMPNKSRGAWGSSAVTNNARSRGGSLNNSFEASVGNSSFDSASNGAIGGIGAGNAGKSRGSTRGSIGSGGGGGKSRQTSRKSTRTPIKSPGRDDGPRGEARRGSAGEDGSGGALPPILSPRASLARERMRESSAGKLPPITAPNGEVMMPMPPDAPRSPVQAWGDDD